jgi:RNA polymerase sigma-70 factor (ECF subfamily)
VTAPALDRLGAAWAVPSPEDVRAAVRDRAALDRVLCAVRPLVLAYCRTRATRLDAEDITQDVLVALCSALPSYRETTGNPFIAFVYGIARHKIADAYRAASRRHAESVAEVPEWPSTDDGPEQHTLRREQSERLTAVLGLLPPRQREVLTLRKYLGFSVTEVAELLGSNPNAVRVYQSRAILRARAMIKETYR